MCMILSLVMFGAFIFCMGTGNSDAWMFMAGMIGCGVAYGLESPVPILSKIGDAISRR